MQPEQREEILQLRSRNLTAKEIARKLGLRPAEVTAVIKSEAERKNVEVLTSGQLAPIAECLIDVASAQALLRLEDAEETAIQQAETEHELDASGLSIVTISRTLGYERFLVATYLVDYWCLGVKECIPPRRMNGIKYKQFVENAYRGFFGDYCNITLEQAQSVILGAVDYAESLGLKPHPDFGEARSHLGEVDTLIPLEFGRDGKPFYMAGPYDDAQKILNTLTRTVGKDNFHFVMDLDEPEEFDSPVFSWSNTKLSDFSE